MHKTCFAIHLYGLLLHGVILQNMYIKDEAAGPGSGGGGGVIKRARVSGGYTGASSGALARCLSRANGQLVVLLLHMHTNRCILQWACRPIVETATSAMPADLPSPPLPRNSTANLCPHT